VPQTEGCQKNHIDLENLKIKAMIRRSDSGKEYLAESDISGSLVEQLNLLPRNGKKKKIALVLNNLKFKAMIQMLGFGEGLLG